MSVAAISYNDYPVARQLASDIQKKAKEIEAEIYTMPFLTKSELYQKKIISATLIWLSPCDVVG
jgi:hypothetical protein